MVYLVIFLILTIVSLSVFLSKNTIENKEQEIHSFSKGEIGENIVFNRISKLQTLYGGYLIKDVLFLDDNNNSHQIDILYFTTRGLFIFEVKNYSCQIYGKANDNYWTCIYNDTHHNKMYNPLKQNEGHAKAINQILSDIQINPYVVFTSSSIFNYENDNVIKDNIINKYFIGYHSIVYNEEEVLKQYRTFVSYIENHPVDYQIHIENIKKYQNL